MRAQASAHRLFFPLASGFAAAIVPLWLAVAGGAAPVPALPPAWWHGHEMLLGFAAAAMAGFLVTRANLPGILLLVAAWLAARVGVWAGGATIWLLLPYPVLLAVHVVPGFVGGARRATNLLFALVPIGLAAAEAAFVLDYLLESGHAGIVLTSAADLVLLLLALMGGRLTRTATAGAVQRTGSRFEAPLGRNAEAATALVLLGHLVLTVAGARGAASGVCLVAASGLCAWRLAGWWVPGLRGRPELSALHVGYGWLAFGLLLMGAGEIGIGPGPTAGLHAAMVGGLGTLAFTVFTRTTVQRQRRPFEDARQICRLAPLLSLAALLRVAADLLPHHLHTASLWAAMAAWSATFTTGAVWLWRQPAIPAGRTRARSSSQSR